MTDANHLGNLSTFRLRRRTPGSFLLVHSPTLPAAADDLLVLLAKHADRTLSARGIELGGRFYTSDDLMALRAEMAAHNINEDRLSVRYNPWDLGEVWVLNPVDNHYLKAMAVDPAMKGMTAYQWRVLKRAIRQRFDGPEHLQNLSQGRNAIRDVVDEAIRKPSGKRRVRAARYLQSPPSTLAGGYAYLKQLGGICASHTSGTGMGTDWHDNDPRAEPIVEIYQGDRNSYEALGAPRVARKPMEAMGGFKPLGMVWNALAMGYRLGFQSSSDHWSTHISYAVALAEEHTRPAILDAFRKRHCYAATDNIVLDVRMGPHIMGDDFVHQGPEKPTLSVRVHGTAPLARVEVIKDFVYVYSIEPKRASVEFNWTDYDPRPGMSWYYVRVLQSDGQLAWASPIWMRISQNR
jgi:hypothetical protein